MNILRYEQVINVDELVVLSNRYLSLTVQRTDDYCWWFRCIPYVCIVSPGDDALLLNGFYYYVMAIQETIEFDLFDGGACDAVLYHFSAADIGFARKGNNGIIWTLQFSLCTSLTQFVCIYLRGSQYWYFEGAVKIWYSTSGWCWVLRKIFDSRFDGWCAGLQANDVVHAFKCLALRHYWRFDLWFNASLLSGRTLSTFGRGYLSTDDLIFTAVMAILSTLYWNCPTQTMMVYVNMRRISKLHAFAVVQERNVLDFNVDIVIAYSLLSEGIDMEGFCSVFKTFLNNQEVLTQRALWNSVKVVWALGWRRPTSWQTRVMLDFVWSRYLT